MCLCNYILSSHNSDRFGQSGRKGLHPPEKCDSRVPLLTYLLQRIGHLRRLFIVSLSKHRVVVCVPRYEGTRRQRGVVSFVFVVQYFVVQRGRVTEIGAHLQSAAPRWRHLIFFFHCPIRRFEWKRKTRDNCTAVAHVRSVDARRVTDRFAWSAPRTLFHCAGRLRPRRSRCVFDAP